MICFESTSANIIAMSELISHLAVMSSIVFLQIHHLLRSRLKKRKFKSYKFNDQDQEVNRNDLDRRTSLHVPLLRVFKNNLGQERGGEILLFAISDMFYFKLI